MEKETSKPIGFHEDKHDFECSCCRHGWPGAEGLRDHRNRLVNPALCLMCAEHSEATGNENVYKMLYDHAQEGQRRYEIAKDERNQMLAHNGTLRAKLTRERIDLAKAIDFLDMATARHWPNGPGEGCHCGDEHCAPCKAGANAWVSQNIQRRRALKRLAS